MKRIISIFGAIFLIFGSSFIGGMFPKQGQAVSGLVCIFLGAVLAIIFIMEEEQRFGHIGDILQSLRSEAEEIDKKATMLVSIEDVLKYMENEKELLENLRGCIEEADKNTGKYEKEVAEQLQTIREEIRADIWKGNEAMEKIQRDIAGIKKVPERMYQMQDELIKKLEEFTLNNSREITELSENIHDDNTALLKGIKKDLRDIIDSIDDYEGRMSQKIEELSQQYQDFRDYNNEIINKMTLMSNEDYELLRGLFDGKKERRN